MRLARLRAPAVHPSLIVMLVALLITAVLFDLMYLSTDDARFAFVAYWSITGGLLSGLACAAFGIWHGLKDRDAWRAITNDLWRGSITVAIVALFGLSWMLRHDDPSFVPSNSALDASFGAALLAIASAWLGGVRIERHGSPVEPHGLNANGN